MGIYKLYTEIRNYIKEQFINTENSPVQLDVVNSDIPKGEYQSRDKSSPEYKRRVDYKKRVIEPYELTLILNRMKEDDNKQWLLTTQFLILTGMRINEFLALNKRDVDLKNKLITVNKSYNISSGNTNPNLPYIYREIFIQPELNMLCLEINCFIEQQNLIYAHKTSNLFFPSNKGDCLSFFAYNRYLKNTSNLVLLRCISSHILRSSHAFLLQEQGVSKDAIAWRLGYDKDSLITRDVKSSLLKKQIENYNQQLAKTKIIL